jgi:peptide/nickel transport system permease protein
MPTARIVRGSVLSIKRKEYVEAAINVGVRERQHHGAPHPAQRFRRHHRRRHAPGSQLPSSPSPPSRFLGLGFPSDVPTWGRLLYEGKDFLTDHAVDFLLPRSCSSR